jgi:hypothetical protein
MERFTERWIASSAVARSEPVVGAHGHTGPQPSARVSAALGHPKATHPCQIKLAIRGRIRMTTTRPRREPVSARATATTSKLRTFDEATCFDWTVPMLSGNLAWDPFA